MSDTVSPMQEGKLGLEKKILTVKFLEPWVIARLPICKRGEQGVDVEHATDSEFQEWVNRNNLPVDEDGIVEWSFDDRCGIINYAIEQALLLQFGN